MKIERNHSSLRSQSESVASKT